MRILLTGATGQVGRAIAVHLAALGHDVIGQSRRLSNVPGMARHIEASLGSPDAVERIISATPPCEAIVHAAASLSHNLYDPSISLANCLGTQQIVQLADMWGTTRLIYISGVPVIGRPRQHPITAALVKTQQFAGQTLAFFIGADDVRQCPPQQLPVSFLVEIDCHGAHCFQPPRSYSACVRI